MPLNLTSSVPSEPSPNDSEQCDEQTFPVQHIFSLYGIYLFAPQRICRANALQCSGKPTIIEVCYWTQSRVLTLCELLSKYGARVQVILVIVKIFKKNHVTQLRDNRQIFEIDTPDHIFRYIHDKILNVVIYFLT